MAEGEGWKVISAWINSRIENLTNKILSGESDVSVGSVVHKKRIKGLDMAIVNIIKDSDRHEVMTWKLLFRKIEDFEKIAREK